MEAFSGDSKSSTGTRSETPTSSDGGSDESHDESFFVAGEHIRSYEHPTEKMQYT